MSINYKYWQEKLLPCPFCGRQGFPFVQIYPQEFGEEVRCDCGARKQLVTVGKTRMSDMLQLVGSWNTRRWSK